MYKPGSSYFVYIVTNPNKTTLYTGVTNDIALRIIEHWDNRNNPSTFAGKYFCYNLVYFERFRYIGDAISREKEIKKWSRDKKISLVEQKNPGWHFLNEEICGKWPPDLPINRY